MAVTDRIQQYVQQLPVPLQAEVLDFVQYLLLKTKREGAPLDDSAWSAFSLASAMRGMEDENAPAYGPADLRETFPS
jgi:hypothetical protein